MRYKLVTLIQKKCPVCGKDFTVSKKEKKRIFCGIDCRYSDIGKKLINQSIKKTMLEKYGVSNPSQLESVKAKRTSTIMDRYGVVNSFQSKELMEKAKQTILEKYGVEYYSQSNEYKTKIKNTCLERYGVDNINKDKKIREKIKQTNLEKYGVEYPIQNKVIKEKVKQTTLERYGVDNYAKTDEYLEKFKKTMVDRYGVENPLHSSTIKEKIKQTNLEKYGVESASQQHIKNIENYNKNYIMQHFIKDDYFLVEDVMKYYGISYSSLTNLKEKFCIVYPNKTNYHHQDQKDIFDFIRTFYSKDIIFNNRRIIKPLELDIYIPDKNFAIEYDGIMFHSFGIHQSSKFNNAYEDDSLIHLRKTDLCEDKGIKLFHIFENEWNDPIKQDIWKSKIKVELGYVDRKINARDCIIKIINKEEVMSFLNENHLQGYTNSSINYGLFYKDELVEVMTFGKSRFNKKYKWELIRACTILNTVVRGGFTKLLKYFKSNNDGSIISYGNRRWTYKNKNVYGGDLINISQPNYYYFKPEDCVLIYRQHFQKHKLADKLDYFDSKLSETENMYNNNYRKIYDCGNLVYELN